MWACLQSLSPCLVTLVWFHLFFCLGSSCLVQFVAVAITFEDPFYILRFDRDYTARLDGAESLMMKVSKRGGVWSCWSFRSKPKSSLLLNNYQTLCQDVHKGCWPLHVDYCNRLCHFVGSEFYSITSSTRRKVLFFISSKLSPNPSIFHSTPLPSRLPISQPILSNWRWRLSYFFMAISLSVRLRRIQNCYSKTRHRSSYGYYFHYRKTKLIKFLDSWKRM